MGTDRRWTESGVPILTPEQQRDLREFHAIQEQFHDEMQAATLAAAGAIPDFARVLSSMSPAQLEEQDRRSRELVRGALLDGAWEPYVKDLRAQGFTYARMGIRFVDWFDLVGSFQASLLPRLMEGRGPEDAARVIAGMTLYLNLAMAMIGEAYLEAKQQIIGQQESALRELSTPVLQIRDRMLLLPIIGVLDSQRALQLTQQLLAAVRSHRAKVVVMDITGVAAVDSKVANHLLQTVAAARLMGARVVVTGLSAEVAHSLVVLGVDTTQLNTTGDLQSGIEEAERILGYQVRQSEAGAAPRRG